MANGASKGSPIIRLVEFVKFIWALKLFIWFYKWNIVFQTAKQKHLHPTQIKEN